MNIPSLTVIRRLLPLSRTSGGSGPDGQPLARDFPDRVEDGPIHPLDGGDDLAAASRRRGLPAADLLQFPLDVANVADGKTLPLHGVQEVLPAGIDGDSSL